MDAGCFLSNHLNHPNHPTPLPKNTNFASFGLIWIKLGVEVNNGQQCSNPELFFDLTPLTQTQPPYPIPP